MDIFALPQKLLSFIVAFSILVVVHEMGHYLAARLCNVKVLRFSLGMGQIIWSRKFGRDQTEWALSAWPLGGYVKMLDARDQTQEPISEFDQGREFTRQSVWARIFILAAGPAANFLLAIGIFTLLNSIGVPEPSTQLRAMAENSAAYQAGLRGGQKILGVDGEAVQLWSQLRNKLLVAALEKKRVVLETASTMTAGTAGQDSQGGQGAATGTQLASFSIDTSTLTQDDLEGDFLKKLGLEVYRAAVLGEMEADSPAAKAGMQAGDKVLALNGRTFLDVADFVQTVNASANREIDILVLRGQQEVLLKATPRAVENADKVMQGRLLVKISAQAEMLQVPHTVAEAFVQAVTQTWDMSVMSVRMLGKMVTGQVSLRNLTGPITIADYAGQSAKIGWISYLHFIAFISMSLGVMNLLPIPVLDGGYLLYYSLEILRGRPLPERFVELAQRAGLGILMTLMAVAMFNDIARHIPIAR